MEQNGISKLDLKRRNRMQIIKLLQQQGPTSRIDLSALLELTRAAVTIITNEMIEQGVLYEKGEVSTVGQKASRGRKKILIDINRNYKFAFGIALDHKKIFIGLSNIGGEVLEKRVYELARKRYKREHDAADFYQYARNDDKQLSDRTADLGCRNLPESPCNPLPELESRAKCCGL